MKTREWADGATAGDWVDAPVMSADKCDDTAVTETYDFCVGPPAVVDNNPTLTGATAVNGGLIALALAALHLIF